MGAGAILDKEKAGPEACSDLKTTRKTNGPRRVHASTGSTRNRPSSVGLQARRTSTPATLSGSEAHPRQLNGIGGLTGVVRARDLANAAKELLRSARSGRNGDRTSSCTI